MDQNQVEIVSNVSSNKKSKFIQILPTLALFVLVSVILGMIMEELWFIALFLLPSVLYIKYFGSLTEYNKWRWFMYLESIMLLMSAFLFETSIINKEIVLWTLVMVGTLVVITNVFFFVKLASVILKKKDNTSSLSQDSSQDEIRGTIFTPVTRRLVFANILVCLAFIILIGIFFGSYILLAAPFVLIHLVIIYFISIMSKNRGLPLFIFSILLLFGYVFYIYVTFPKGGDPGLAYIFASPFVLGFVLALNLVYAMNRAIIKYFNRGVGAKENI